MQNGRNFEKHRESGEEIAFLVVINRQYRHPCRTEVLDLAELLKETSKFEDLFRNAEARYPFTTVEWYEAWVEGFGDPKHLKIVVAEDEQTHQWHGFLPLMSTRLGITDLWAKTTEIPGGAYADYNLPLIRKDMTKAVIPELLNTALSIVPKGSIFLLRHMPVDNLITPAVLEYLNQWNINHSILRHVCPVLRLEGDYAAIRNKWPKNHRGDISRQTRRLEKLGSLHLKLIDKREEVAGHLERLFRMHRSQWRERGFASIFEAERIRSYYRRITTNMVGQSLHFSALLLNGEAISYHLGFQFEGRFYYYKPTYDIAYREYSPGKVHIDFLVRDCINKGHSAFDFLKGDEPYKFSWTDRTDEIISVFISSAGNSLQMRWLLNGKKRSYEYIGGVFRWLKRRFPIEA